MSAGPGLIRLERRGPHTHIHASLCARCPMGPAGCCATPPGLEWSDLGRIVALGGRGFLLDEMASGRLRPGGRGLLIRRVAARKGETLRCAFHGAGGCTIAPALRAATCNYYVCDEAVAQAEDAAAGAEAAAVRDALVERYARWDREIARRVAGRWPEGPPWDEGFLAWLGGEFRARTGSPA